MQVPIKIQSFWTKCGEAECSEENFAEYVLVRSTDAAGCHKACLKSWEILQNQFRISSFHSKVSLLGVDSLWGDCTFIPVDWGS